MRSLPRVALVVALLFGGAACSSDDRPSVASQASNSDAVGASSAAEPAAKAQAAAPPTEPASPSGGTTPILPQIDSSCRQDVSDALQSFLRTVPSDTTITFPANGCYRVNKTLTLDGHNKVVIEGNGAKIEANTGGSRNRRHLVVSNSDDITIRNLTIVGYNPQPGTHDARVAFQHAFELTTVHRLVLDNVTANRVYGDFVYIGGEMDKPSTDVTVMSSRFDGSGRHGISVTDAERVLIKSNHIANAGRSLIEIEPNSASGAASDVRITGNTTGAAADFWLANKSAADTIGPIEIDANTMEVPTGGLLFAVGVPGVNHGPYFIHDNELIANNAVSDERSVGAFVFGYCHDITITNNRVTFVERDVMPAVELRSSSAIHIAGNDFDGATQPVVSDDATTGLSVSS